MAELQTLALKIADGVASVQLDRPKKANALNEAMAGELIELLHQLDQDGAVKVVVIKGSGPFFSSGIDLEYLHQIQGAVLSEGENDRAARMYQIILHLQRVTQAVEDCSKPVIAQIDGICFGFGVDFAAACDLRYCSKRARFSVKEVDLAIVADLGTLQRLPGIIGEGHARELAFTGREFHGQEAAAIGFANRCYDNTKELETAVAELAATLAAKSPHTLRGIKSSMNFSRDHTVAEGLAHIADANATALLHSDLQEAVTAFLEKRPPEFRD